MEIYIILWVSFFFASFLKKDITFWLGLFFIVLVSLYSFRGEDVGVDTSTYNDIYNEIKWDGYLVYIEPLWNILNIAVARLGGNFNLLLFFSGFFTVGMTFKAIKDESINPMFSTFIYYSMYLYCGSFNIMRQYLALAFLLLAYCYYKKNNMLFILFFSCAVGFHTSSIFFLLIIPFSRLEIKKSKILPLLVVSFILGTFFCSKLLPLIFSFMYSGYGEKDLLRTDSLAVIFVLVMDVFFYIVTLSTNNRLFTNKWFKLFILSILVLNITYPLELGTRLYLIFAISNIIVFPLIISESSIISKHFFKFIVVLYFTAQFFRMILVNANEVYPYVFQIYS